MARQIDKLRNIGIIAHIDAGKTTVTERMLFYSGAKHRVGMVDKGTTVTDDDPEEQERGITIYSACVTFNWKDVHINLLDTPGHVDFTAEVERCLRVLDGAVVVFSAREGVEAQSETVWRQADHYEVPRIVFINKMDREGADFDAVFGELSNRLGAKPVAIQIPAGAGPAHTSLPFYGVIDLVRMRMLSFDDQKDGLNILETEIPEELVDTSQVWRLTMLEQLAEYSDELTDLLLLEEDIPESIIHDVLRKGTTEQSFQPVMCGSALHGIGVQPILDAIQAYLPSPLDRPPVTGTFVSTGRKQEEEQAISRKPAVDEPFCGLVFKVVPAKTGDISWARIYSGQIAANSRIYNPGKDKKDNVAQLWQIYATRKDPQGKIDNVQTGDIVGIVGLRHTITGDTICDASDPILLESIEFPETVISMAIEPENTTERDKLEDTLEMLMRQDPTLEVFNGETGQTLLRGMGELHLEVVKNRLLREFKLNVRFHKPQVSYRETIAKEVEVTGECNRLINGVQKYARITIRMEPAEEVNHGLAVTNQLAPDSLPPDCLEATFDELRHRGSGGGVIAGFPLMRLKVTVLDAEIAEEGSDDVAFRIATADAFNRCLQNGKPVLLEPIMRLSITTPADYLGDFVGDLQQRRAMIVSTESYGDRTEIEAHAPLKELFGYSSAMRSLSQGRAGCSIAPLHYMPAPEEDLRELGF
ncbi:MAG: elongation factor G [Pirellulales bacterium]|jgi:elongation factor G